MAAPISSNCDSKVYCSPQLTDIARKTRDIITHLFKKTLEPLAGYFLRICVFKDAALQGDKFSQWVFTPIARGIMNLWMKCQGIPERLLPFSAERLKKSADFLAEFAEVRTTQTSDGTTIQWALYTPEKFNQWIQDNGGVRDGEWIRPREDKDWDKLQRLREFKVFKEEGRAFKVPTPIANSKDNCVLRCQGWGRKMPMDKSFIGLHMAANVKYAIFDWRPGTEVKGLFEDVEAVYQALLKEGFTPEQIKPMGSCRATFAIADLKRKHHDKGLEVVMVHPPSSLRDTIIDKPWPANQIGLIGLPRIEDGVVLDSVERFNSLQRNHTNTTCLIVSEGDKTIPQKAAKELLKAIENSGPCHLIVEPKKQGEGDPHFDEPLLNPIVLDQYLQFLDGTSS